jgi:hypothetical protein
MPLLLLGAVCAVSLPMAAAIILGSYVPAIGELRPGSGWRFLHLLWIYPVMHLVAVAVGGFSKHFTGISDPRGIAGVIADIVVWISLTVMFGVFFVHAAGAAIADAAARALSWPFFRMLERGAERREQEEAAEGSSGGADEG